MLTAQQIQDARQRMQYADAEADGVFVGCAADESDRKLLFRLTRDEVLYLAHADQSKLSNWRTVKRLVLPKVRKHFWAQRQKQPGFIGGIGLMILTAILSGIVGAIVRWLLSKIWEDDSL